eukprot:6004007-Prorocentrum_lima.AAC.1
MVAHRMLYCACSKATPTSGPKVVKRVVRIHFSEYVHSSDYSSHWLQHVLLTMMFREGRQSRTSKAS